jgi:hypothetical protein
MTYGLFHCRFCTSDDLVDAHEEHEHDGYCGDRVWADELPGMPVALRVPASKWADAVKEQLEGKLGRVPDDATLADVLLTLIDKLPEQGRAILDRLLSEEWYPACRCCGQRAELLTPLLPLPT